MSRRNATLRPHKRKGYWYLIRRVPIQYSSYDKRGLVILSTGIPITDDPRGHAARTAVAKLDAGLVRYWRDLKSGHDVEAEQRYKLALETARQDGVAYAPAHDVAQLPIMDIVRRLELIDNPKAVENNVKVSGVLGGENAPTLMVSTMREIFEQIVATSLLQKSERQIRRWRLNRNTAVASLIEALGGDRPLSTLNRTDALKFRSHWQDRVLQGEIDVSTANKVIGSVAGMFRVINEHKMLGLPALFEKTSIQGGVDKQRVAFSPAFVQANIMAPGMFTRLNLEARCMIYLLAETGLRLSEACNLSKKTIRLDHPVPHVQVRPDVHLLWP